MQQFVDKRRLSFKANRPFNLLLTTPISWKIQPVAELDIYTFLLANGGSKVHFAIDCIVDPKLKKFTDKQLHEQQKVASNHFSQSHPSNKHLFFKFHTIKGRHWAESRQTRFKETPAGLVKADILNWTTYHNKVLVMISLTAVVNTKEQQKQLDRHLPLLKHVIQDLRFEQAAKP